MGSDIDTKNPPHQRLSQSERKRLKKLRKEERTLKKFKKDERLSQEDTSTKKKKKKQGDEHDRNEDVESTTESTAEKVSQAPQTGRKYTISIAVPGSILSNAQSPALRAYLAGQVARAAAIFNVDEIIVFDDTGGNDKTACEQMARILQFLECPQYLRKYLFPLHPDLQYSGVISPLDLPHHLRKDEILDYREGVVLNKPHKEGKGCFVYIGLEKDVFVDKSLPENKRVTVRLDNRGERFSGMRTGYGKKKTRRSTDYENHI